MSDAYQMAADDLIAVMYANEREYETIRFHHGLQIGYMPQGLHRDVTRMIFELRDNGKSVHDTTIIDRVPSCTPQWLAQRIALYDETRIGTTSRDNVRIVRTHGLHRGKMNIARKWLAKIAEGDVKDSESEFNHLIDALQSVERNTTVQRVVAKDHAQHNRELWNKQGVMLGFSGIPFMDANSTGYEAGHMWAVVAAYKQRKTTLALNLLLQATMANEQSVAMYSREMAQGEVQAILEAMIAVGYIINDGHYDTKERTSKGYLDDARLVSGKIIQNLYGKYDKLGSIRHGAITKAQATYDTLSHRIYDTKDEHGGLDDFDSLKAMILRDCAVHGGKIHIVDYAQKFRQAGQREYEVLLEISNGLQQLAQKHGIFIILLAQLNETAISNDMGYGSGVSGGGALAKDVNAMWKTGYKNGIDLDDANKLQISLMFSRASEQGVSALVDIHAPSGLLIDNRWLNGMKHEALEANL